MTMDVDNGNGAERGVRVFQKVALTFEYDTGTHQVKVAGDTMPLSLAQMIAGEGVRILEEQRRMAAAVQLQQQMAERARTAAIVDSVRVNKMGHV